MKILLILLSFIICSSAEAQTTRRIQSSDVTGALGYTPIPSPLTGDMTTLGSIATLATVNANVGSFGSATNCVSFTTNAKGLITAASAVACTPAAGSLTGLGTGVGTALGINIGSAGAPVLFNGAGGTPSSLTLTNATGLPTTALTGALQAAQEPAHTGDVTNIAGSLALSYTNVVPASKGGAGTITGALKGNGSGTVSQAACADLSNAVASCSTDATNATNITSGTLPTARLSLAPIVNSLAADVLLNNISNFFDGPSVAQGTTGTWWASGTVTLTDTAGVATMSCKLWDGTTVIDSAVHTIGAAGQRSATSLSGFIASPAGNIRISCNDGTSTSGKILFNLSGLSKDSTISAFRIQ